MGTKQAASAQKRRAPTRKKRDLIFEKTGGNCHVCGGPAGEGWHADHVVPHKRGGTSKLSNLLPSCRECNGLRSAGKPGGIRESFRIGVYARRHMKNETRLGRKLKALLDKRLKANELRRTRKKAEK